MKDEEVITKDEIESTDKKEKKDKAKVPEKVLSLMGFAARARKIASGYNTARTTMEKGKAKLLILAEDLSENSKEKMISLASRYKVRCEENGKTDEMSHITGNEGKGIFVITEKQFADAIAKAIYDTRCSK